MREVHKTYMAELEIEVLRDKNKELKKEINRLKDLLDQHLNIKTIRMDKEQQKEYAVEIEANNKQIIQLRANPSSEPAQTQMIINEKLRANQVIKEKIKAQNVMKGYLRRSERDIVQRLKNIIGFGLRISQYPSPDKLSANKLPENNTPSQHQFRQTKYEFLVRDIPLFYQMIDLL